MAVTLEETQVVTDQVLQVGIDPALTAVSVGNQVIVAAALPGGTDQATAAATLGGQALTQLYCDYLTGFVSRLCWVGYRTIDGTEGGTPSLNFTDTGGSLTAVQSAAWRWSGANAPALVAVTGEGGLDSFGDGTTPEDITIAAVTGGTNRKALVLVWGQTTDLGTTPTLSTPTGYTLGDTDTDLSGTNRAIAIACSADAASNVGATVSTLDNSGGAGAIPYFDDSGSIVVTVSMASSDPIPATASNELPIRARRVNVKELPFAVSTAMVKEPPR